MPPPLNIVTNILRGVRQGRIEDVKVGPAGVHLHVLLGQPEEQLTYLDILCCGKMLLIRNQKPRLLMDTSNYIDAKECKHIPFTALITEFEVDTPRSALMLYFEDQQQLILQALLSENEHFPIYISGWSGIPYHSTKRSSVTIEV